MPTSASTTAGSPGHSRLHLITRGCFITACPLSTFNDQGLPKIALFSNRGLPKITMAFHGLPHSATGGSPRPSPPALTNFSANVSHVQKGVLCVDIGAKKYSIIWRFGHTTTFRTNQHPCSSISFQAISDPDWCAKVGAGGLWACARWRKCFVERGQARRTFTACRAAAASTGRGTFHC